MEHKKEIIFIKAKKTDFVEFSHYDKITKKRVFKIKHGVPFWLINSKGIIEDGSYRTHENMDIKSFQKYLLHEQVLIIKFNILK